MTLWPSSVVVGGASLPLAGVLADLTIHHGRADVMDDATASTCQLRLQDVAAAFVQSFRVGVSLVVNAKDGAAAEAPRFTGVVTDARLDVDELEIIAAGRLSTLARYPIGGTVSWPAEKWSQRVARIFAEAGLAAQLVLVPDPDFDPLLAARDHLSAGETTLGDYLNFLGPMLGTAIVDRPDGKILVQAIGGRSLASLVQLDPADVAYSPPWEQVLPPGNVVTVRYTGDQSESVEAREPASIAVYGERPVTIDTSFANAGDATARGNERLARSAFPHWNIPEAPVLRGLELAVGAALELTGMPAESPFEPWTPILEGWTDTVTGDDWTMTLSLSDPLASGVVLPWNTVPPTADYLWNSVDAATDWTEALTLEALNAG